MPRTSIKAVAVEKWLGTLDMADGTKSKLRNQLSCLFSHARRHKLYLTENPLTEGPSAGARQATPDFCHLR
jgi:hypothetical protein